MLAFAVSDSPPDGPPTPDALPRSLLYSTSAGFGGTGLHLTSLQSALAANEAGILARAIGFSNRQSLIPGSQIRSLVAHPVRLLGGLRRDRYYGSKKRYLDWIASREIARGRYDCLHSWSGDCLRSLIAARQFDLPTLLEIPTWHRDKGKLKPFETRSERELRARRGWTAALDRLPHSRQRSLLEYDLADLILVQSSCAAESFLAAGLPASKIVRVARGADVDRFTPAESPPDRFRAVFAGALIKRKGVHHLLKAWQELALPDSELVLAGTVHPEIEPFLREFAGPSVKLLGFSRDLPELFRSASVFIFPSECEGWAKVTFEAAAAGLPLIATRESGDGVIDGVTGLLVPANDAAALADRIRFARHNPDQMAAMGRAGRDRIARCFTWRHFRLRLLHAYAQARALRGR